MIEQILDKFMSKASEKLVNGVNSQVDHDVQAMISGFIIESVIRAGFISPEILSEKMDEICDRLKTKFPEFAIKSVFSQNEPPNEIKAKLVNFLNEIIEFKVHNWKASFKALGDGAGWEEAIEAKCDCEQCVSERENEE